MTDINRKKTSPGVKAYYAALQRILDLQRRILTGALTHYGERGRNDEERLKSFLKQVLPGKFGIGTGFIVNGNPEAMPSNQTDIIISDHFFNSPLHRELAAEVYPIETVYATVEVKGLFSNRKDRDTGKTDLDKTLENIQRIRDLAQDKQYVEYRSVPKEDYYPEYRVVKKIVIRSSLPPRAYLFAYSTKGWSNLNHFADYVEKNLLQHNNSHLHGIVVLDKDWFLKQKSYTGRERKVFRFEGNCLLRFINTLLHGIQSIPMRPMDIDVYHEPDASPSHLFDKEDSGYDGEIEEEENEEYPEIGSMEKDQGSTS
jgi:hypothetical protein